MSNTEFYNFTGFESKGNDTDTDKSYSLWELPYEEKEQLYSIAKRLSEYQIKLNATDDISGDELAEIVGLQVALDVYKSLLGVDFMSNQEFFDFIEFENETEEPEEPQTETFELWELPYEEIENIHDIQDRLQQYQNRLNATSADISGYELAEIVGLQVALDVYKELLGVPFMDN